MKSTRKIWNLQRISSAPEDATEPFAILDCTSWRQQ